MRPCNRRNASVFSMSLQNTPLQPLTPARLLHVIAKHALATALTPHVSACHCEPVRTLVWQSVSPQRNLTSLCYFGQIRNAFRIRPKYCVLLCAAAGDADCHVASLLAMTEGGRPCKPDTLPPSACHCEPVRTLVWQSALLAVARNEKWHFRQIRRSLRIRPKCYFFLPFSAGLRIAASLRSSQ